MERVSIDFEKAIVDSQQYGSNDEFMVSRVFFSVEEADKQLGHYYVDVKQTVGSSFETAPLEIGLPVGFKKGLNYAEFREAVEKYYRLLFGKQGRLFRVEGVSNVRMQNTTFEMRSNAVISSEQEGAAW